MHKYLRTSQQGPYKKYVSMCLLKPQECICLSYDCSPEE